MTIQFHNTFAEWADNASSHEEALPTMYDLPSENPVEPNMPDQFHTWQSQLLTATFEPPDYGPKQRMAASGLNLYYDKRNTDLYKCPDWYAVLGIDHLYKKHDIRLSYIIWQEKVIPAVVVELLSLGTPKEDFGHTLLKLNKPHSKWEVYEQILCIPYCVIFNRHTDTLRVFQLKEKRYHEQDITDNRIWFQELKLGLGLWRGKYFHAERLWLRWYDTKGNWVPTPAEREKKRAEMEKAQKESFQKQMQKERKRTQKLRAQLHALGIEPEV